MRSGWLPRVPRSSVRHLCRHRTNGYPMASRAELTTVALVEAAKGGKMIVRYRRPRLPCTEGGCR